ncbi:MAG: 16S rRNA (cytosine(1402)-N(4))-methyltransferase RsmH [Thermodesulfobacteriota bacterium]
MGKRSKIEHLPVMVKEVVRYLNCQQDGIYIDGTLGSGGHSLEILKCSSPNGRLIGIDWDEDAITVAKNRLNHFQGRVTIIYDNFKNIGSIVKNLKVNEVDGILLDLGVSSIQLENEERGFSFKLEGPIDMRMDKSSILKAFDLVNFLSTPELERMLWNYGEERFGKRIARSIADYRKHKPISTTVELADIVSAAIPSGFRPKRIHPATKTFQAIRIALNDELRNLETAIQVGVDLLKKGSKFCVISFHSLEDRVVKQSFKALEKRCICPPDMPECNCQKESKVKVLTRKPILPSEDEVRKNPRSRSAKLRVAERV